MIKEMHKGAGAMRALGVRLMEMIEPLHKGHYDLCSKEKDQARDRDTGDRHNPSRQTRHEERFHRENEERDMMSFDKTRLTRILREGRNLSLSQLWTNGGEPVWKGVSAPAGDGAMLLMMLVRRRTSRGISKVWQAAERIWPPVVKEKALFGGQGKSTEVLIQAPGPGKRREVVMTMDIATGKRTFKMTIDDNETGEKEKTMHAPGEPEDLEELDSALGWAPGGAEEDQ